MRRDNSHSTALKDFLPPMKTRFLALALAAVTLGACDDSFVPDFNNPNELDYTVFTSRDALQSAVTGLADGDRQLHDFQVLIQETIGRNVYRIDGSEPRYITSPLGSQNVSRTNFIGAAIWTGPYANIRTGRLLIAGSDSSAIALSPLTDAEKAGVRGYAKTLIALQYIRLVEVRDTVGVPIVLDDDVVPDPIRCKPAVLEYVSALLDTAATDLAAAGTAFPFELPAGFAGFDTPAGMLQFNRGLKARNEIYRAFQAYGAAPTFASIDQAALGRAQEALSASFYNPAGDFNTGVYHVYSTSAGEYSNPNFGPSIMRINPRVVAEADPGDLRVPAKVNIDPTSVANNEIGGSLDVPSGYLDKVNASPVTPLPIISNAELILLQAEIFWGQGRYAEALAQSNIVRSSAQGGGLAARVINVGTPEGQGEVLREILKQKRYQLLFTSPSRHVDYRMFGILNELGQERGNDPVSVLRLPQTELDARGGEGSCTA
jgi:starch-binding outer membrane protein, SusD/RagB family